MTTLYADKAIIKIDGKELMIGTCSIDTEKMSVEEKRLLVGDSWVSCDFKVTPEARLIFDEWKRARARLKLKRKRQRTKRKKRLRKR